MIGILDPCSLLLQTQPVIGATTPMAHCKSNVPEPAAYSILVAEFMMEKCDTARDDDAVTDPKRFAGQMWVICDIVPRTEHRISTCARTCSTGQPRTALDQTDETGAPDRGF